MALPNIQEVTKIYTRDDLRVLYEQNTGSEKRFELIDREIYEVPTASHLYSWIASRTFELLALFIVPRNLGKVYMDGIGYDLPNGDSVIPDLSYFTSENALPPAAVLTVAPDLAVEVVSPSNTTKALRRKINGYLESGTRRVWAVYPDDMEVDVHSLQADGSRANRTFGVGDTLTGEDVVPGFAVKVAEFFPQPQPAAPKADA